MSSWKEIYKVGAS